MRNLVNTLRAAFGIIVIFSWLGSGALAQSQKPANIILILADDQGWNFTSVRMDPENPLSRSDYHETPNLERLAAKGMCFSRAYAAHSVCTPSRYAIQFGTNPARMHVTRNFLPDRPANVRPEDSLAQTLKRTDSRYRTAHLGKWHLPAYTPAELGYDLSDGSTGNEDANRGAKGYDPVADPKRINELTRRGIEFVEDCRKQQQPFFLQISHYAIHGHEDARAATVAKYRAKNKGKFHHWDQVAACNEDLDASVGKLLDYLETSGQDQNTYIVYTSDNGGLAGDRIDINRPLAEGKFTMYEGGIRVPLIVKGPMVASGQSCKVPVILTDLLPTVLEIAGAKTGELPKSVEGGSWMPLFEGKQVADLARPVPGMIYSSPHLIFLKGRLQSEITAYTRHPFKLIYNWRHKTSELYNLDQDLWECHNLSYQQPERVEALKTEMLAYLKTHGERVQIKSLPDFLRWSLDKKEKEEAKH
jgi:arylsulfatase A-like enzyme